MFITGGSRGLGRELVRHFTGRYNVIFGWHHSAADAHALAEEIATRGDWALPLQLDVRDPEQLGHAAQVVHEAVGPCQALLHTTGTFSLKRLSEMDAATWREELDSTVNAGFFAWRAFGDQLKTQPRSRVIFIGDSAAEQLRARRESTAYYVGKHGLVLLARTIASEHQQTGLTCNVVSPGVLPNSIDLDQPGMSANVQFSELAGVIDFLLSPAADAISGSQIVASRGWNV
jgi:3-oxoacyl-[acyl-carrier protein] reductase